MQHMRISRVIYALLPAALMLIPLGSAVAQEPPTTVIAFTSERDGNQEIYRMNADGSNQINLTQHPANDYAPSWTPDGRQVVFTSERDGNPEIYIMNADGSDVRRLTETPAADYAPVVGVAAPMANEQTQPAEAIPAPITEAVAEAPVTNSPTPGLVPDLTGLNVPQAAAALNQSGLLLGNVNNANWTAVSPAAPNSIGAQSVAAGQMTEAGTMVDVGVLRTFNAVLVWDDNDITLVNNTGLPLDLTTIRFTTVDGEPGASFAGGTWADELRVDRCAQLWSVFRSTPRPIDECGVIQFNRSTEDPSAHFWTGVNGATAFQVIQNGEARATCQIAEGGCEFYLQGIGDDTGADQSTITEPELEFIYLAYDLNQLIIKNTSDDAWLPLTETVLYAGEGGAAVAVGDASLYGNLQVVGDVSRLAPNQCIWFAAADASAPPEDCDPIVRVDLPPTNLFWRGGFEVGAASDGERRACGVPNENTLSLCILPN